MNETIKTILARRSVRAYKDKPVEADKIDLLLECALAAPTGRNVQPWFFSVVNSRDLLNRISAANKQIMSESADPMAKQAASDPNFDSFRGAPLVIIVSGRRDASMAAADCANAVENMAIAACSLGLGTCYLAGFKPALLAPGGKALLKELQIPEGYDPLYGLAIGYANEDPGERPARDRTVIAKIN
ncbi:MAG: nitroreductase family protein [Saccharofermentanales bacterium]|jgi:nitroreductase